MSNTETRNLIADIENFLCDYAAFSEPGYSLVLALWLVGTFLWMDFDAFPYLVITSETKRSGKSRTMELLSFVCHNPLTTPAITAAALYEATDKDEPTVFIDEAETLASEAASTLRAVLNTGYRKGQTLKRAGDREYKVYCPKVFILIGDVFNTLKDRSIYVWMRRAEPAKRFRFEIAKSEGEQLRKRVESWVKELRNTVTERFLEFDGLTFLTDRDEEIWTPLFVIASIFCPDRVEELSKIAVDMATEKTQESRRYSKLLNDGAEERAARDEYAKRLIADVYDVIYASGHKGLSSVSILEALKQIPTSPWRRFEGDGLTVHSMAALLSTFKGIQPGVFRMGSGRKNSKTVRGYRLIDIERGMKSL